MGAVDDVGAWTMDEIFLDGGSFGSGSRARICTGDSRLEAGGDLTWKIKNGGIGEFTPSHNESEVVEDKKWIIHVDGSSTQYAGGI